MGSSIYKLILSLRSPILGLTEREIGILKLTDGQGRVGYGEMSPLPGFSSNLWAPLEWAHICAREMMNGNDNPVSTHVNGLITNPETALETAKLYELNGYKHVKIKVGIGSWKNILETIIADTNLMLRLDANGKLTVTEAADLIANLPKQRIDYFEDPVDTKYLPQFYNETQFPFAQDSRLTQLEGQTKTVIKPTLLGYIPNIKDIVLSSAYESALGISHIVHFAHKLNLQNEVHGLDTLSIFTEPLFNTERVKSELHVPSMKNIKKEMDQLTENLTPTLEF